MRLFESKGAEVIFVEKNCRNYRRHNDLNYHLSQKENEFLNRRKLRQPLNLKGSVKETNRE